MLKLLGSGLSSFLSILNKIILPRRIRIRRRIRKLEKELAKALATQNIGRVLQIQAELEELRSEISDS